MWLLRLTAVCHIHHLPRLTSHCSERKGSVWVWWIDKNREKIKPDSDSVCIRRKTRLMQLHMRSSESSAVQVCMSLQRCNKVSRTSHHVIFRMCSSLAYKSFPNDCFAVLAYLCNPWEAGIAYCVVTVLRTGRSSVLIPVGAGDISLQNRPDRLWGRPSPLRNR